MSLGGNIDPIQKGKLHIWDHINMKPTNTADLYLMEDFNTLHRRVTDEYPEY